MSQRPQAIQPELSTRVVQWYQHHGRRDLPWQRERNAYRVWVSEIMLQQTQVTTVIPYFQRFIARFPAVTVLGASPVDEVLHYWSGLGYYARARHLHRAAQIICERHAGAVPREFESLCALPGIGRSTAGAILALAHDVRHPILDGNVKRVLARYHAVPGWPGQARVASQLWALSEYHTPFRRVRDYTQGMMDLGALICTRVRPSCARCPVVEGCEAFGLNRQQDFPSPRPGRARPLRRTVMLLVCNDRGEVLLEQRPPAGVWGGLWSFPEVRDEAQVGDWCRDHLGTTEVLTERWKAIRHPFTHFQLHITPVRVRLQASAQAVMEGSALVWYKLQPMRRGIAAPVAKLLGVLRQQTEGETHGSHGQMRDFGQGGRRT